MTRDDYLEGLTPRGTYLNLTAPRRTPRMLWAAWTTARTILAGETANDDSADLELLRGLAESGELRVVIDRRYRLADVATAHRYVDLGHKKGAVVVSVP